MNLIVWTGLVVDRITGDGIESHVNLGRHESGLGGEQLSCRNFMGLDFWVGRGSDRRSHFPPKIRTDQPEYRIAEAGALV